jgi:hypothetical protein
LRVWLVSFVCSSRLRPRKSSTYFSTTSRDKRSVRCKRV